MDIYWLLDTDRICQELALLDLFFDDVRLIYEVVLKSR